METLFFFIFLIPLLFPFVIIFFKYLKKIINIIKYEYFIFLLFIIFIIFFYLLYLLFYFIIFFYKNYLFYRYYYPRYNASKFFYYRKIVYFSFWRYLLVYTIKHFFIFFYFVKLQIKSFFFKFIFNAKLNIMIVFYVKIKFLTFYYFDYIFLYNKFLNFLEHLHIFFNLDELLFFFRRKFNLTSNKHIEDPIWEKLGNLKFSKSFYNYYPFWYLRNRFSFYFFFFRDFLLLLAIYSLSFLINIYIFINNKINIYFIIYEIYIFIKKLSFYFLSLIKIIYISFIKLIFKIKYIFLFFIYYFISFFIYIINFLLTYLYKLRWKLCYLFIIIIILKNIWILHLFFVILYKHYTFNLPIINLKESIRFFNFEFIDLRNYYNLINLHNTLVDISLYNNVIYNNLLKYLHLNLDIYGMKLSDIGNSSNINLYAIDNIRNNDTFLLNNLLKNYNKLASNKINKLKWYVNEKYITKVKYEYNYTDEPALPHVNPSEIINQIRDTNWINESEAVDNNVITSSMFYPITKEQSEHYSLALNYYYYFYSKTWNEYWSEFPVSRFKNLKLIPFQLFYRKKDFKITDDLRLINEYMELILEEFERHKLLNWIIIIRKALRIGTLKLRKKFEPFKYREYFFSIYYDYKNYKENIFIKNEIPTYNLSDAFFLRGISNYKHMYNLDIFFLSPEEYVHKFYRKLSTQNLYSNSEFNIKYIYKKFPYRLNTYFSDTDIISRHLNFFKTIKTGTLILKKFMYLYNIHIDESNRYHRDFLESDLDLIIFILRKWKNFDLPFINSFFNHNFSLKTVNINNMEFWSSFYYLKFNKYFYTRYKNTYKGDYNFNSMFIIRGRKDFFHIRQYFLRVMSTCIYNHIHENMKSPVVYPVFIKDPDLLESYKNNYKKLKSYKPVITRLFKEFQRVFNFGTHLTGNRTNKIITRAFCVYLEFLKKRFKDYSNYIELNNQYNIFYKKQIISYKRIVLNKISNLKRFFYRKTKKNNGYKIFSYLNCFSLNFHIKHILWHSPYYYLLFNNFKNIIKMNNKELNINYCFNYIFDNYFIIINNYSFIFNLFLNTIDVKEEWSYFLTLGDSCNELKPYYLCNDAFYYYYNYGNFFFFNLNFLDLYRIFISLLFKYYNSFLFRLSRYSYILKYKNYTFKSFFFKYFNFKNFIKYLYIRFRLQIYRWQFWSRWIKRAKLRLLKPKKHFSWRVRRIYFFPFWFHFNEYVKLFIYLLLKYYYSKSFFLYWWFNKKYNYDFITYAKIKYFVFIFKIKIFILNINTKYFIFSFNTKNILYNYLSLNTKNILYNYLSLIFKFEFIRLDLNIIYNIFKIYYIFFGINLNLNIKKLLYFKIIFYQIIKNYFNLFFKLKNRFVYLKSNYYYFRQQRVKIRWGYAKSSWFLRNHSEIVSFIRTTTKRDINRFSHFAKNFFLLKHLYFYNINNYIYIYNYLYSDWALSSILFNPLITLKFHIFHFFILIYSIYVFLFIFIYLLLIKNNKQKKILHKLKNKKYVSNILYFKNFKTFNFILFKYYKKFSIKKYRMLNYLINQKNYVKYSKIGIGDFISILNITKWFRIFNKVSKIYFLKTKFKKKTYFFQNENYVNESLINFLLFFFYLWYH